MEFDVIYLGTRSCTIEIDNHNPYYAEKPYSVYVNDTLYASDIKTNIFSIYNLEPNKNYEIIVDDGSLPKFFQQIKTKKEYVTINVKDIGAHGDGKTLDTNFLQAAMEVCPKDGRVYIPEGTYLTGPLFLKSDITIELHPKAHLLGATDRKLYPILPGMIYTTDEKGEYNLGSWEGNPISCFASIITGVNVKNVNIIGTGIIDGNAQNSDWWVNIKEKRGAWRPRGVFLNHCENICFQGVTVTNTPSWNLHPYFSKNIRFIDMKLISPKDSPNTDGCDPESCKNVDIIGVHFSVGDDCIAIKAGKIYMGAKYKKPSENFNIRNCSMNFGHGAVVLGSEMAGGIKDIKVSKCIFNETDRGLRIKTRRGRGKDAIIDGITFENIKMDNVLTPLVINMFYFCDPDGKTEYVWSKEKLPVDDRTPYLGKFTFKHIDCQNVNCAAGAFYGLPEQPIGEINFNDVHFTYADNPQAGKPAMMSFAEDIKGKGLLFNYVKKVNMKDVTFTKLNDKPIECVEVGEINQE